MAAAPRKKQEAPALWALGQLLGALQEREVPPPSNRKGFVRFPVRDLRMPGTQDPGLGIPHSPVIPEEQGMEGMGIYRRYLQQILGAEGTGT